MRLSHLRPWSKNHLRLIVQRRCLILHLLLHQSLLLLLHLHHLLGVEHILVHYAREVVGGEQDIHVVCVEDSLKILVHSINLNHDDVICTVSIYLHPFQGSEGGP